MHKLSADRVACQGYSNCLVIAPEVYDMSDDGKVTLLVDTIEDGQLGEVQEAVASCPVAALQVQ